MNLSQSWMGKLDKFDFGLSGWVDAELVDGYQRTDIRMAHVIQLLFFV